MSDVVDLGHDHTLRYFAWSPDRDLNPQYDGVPDEPKAGAIIDHKKPDGSGDCSGAVNFDTPVMRQLRSDRALWTVESWEPLTISPSVLCSCGDHGFIREGKWVPA
jgi:hypothetical protein